MYYDYSHDHYFRYVFYENLLTSHDTVKEVAVGD